MAARSDRASANTYQTLGRVVTTFFLTVCAVSCTGHSGSTPSLGTVSPPSFSRSPIPPTPTPTPTSPGTPPATASGTPPTGSAVTARDADDGRVLHLKVGQQLRVLLNSTYWQIHPSSPVSVLRELGAPQISPHPAGCVAGAGCGTASATFDTVGQGTATATASRTSCGEALGCTGATARYVIHVVVR